VDEGRFEGRRIEKEGERKENGEITKRSRKKSPLLPPSPTL
jgi:hypothetical protein